MAKVFRLHRDGADTITGWGVSQRYNAAVIDQIADPAGATATKEITSIPSPFARMDLVKEAFAFVCREEAGGLAGNTIHHKMVSHALDIAQMFFNFPTYRDNGLLQLVRWDRGQIDVLLNGASARHKLLGNTLRLFMDADTGQFNFNGMQGLYMLRYTGPGAPAPMTIIGSTSPASLFYTSANSHDFLQGQIVFGGHQALSPRDFVALKDRADQNFVVWMYALKRSIPDFPNRFREVDDYLNLTFGQLSHTLQNSINGMTDATLHDRFDALELAPGIPVEILGTQLAVKRPADVGQTSDFAINTRRQMVRKPLVLPGEPFARQWTYTDAQWQQATEVPLYPGGMAQRRLPADGTLYPYLTMTDFLEDKLIETESRPNGDDFFDGNLNDEAGGDHAFLLPVKRIYFEYFTADDLRQNLSITCSNAPGGGYTAKVTLKIPVRGGTVTFSRTYHQAAEPLNPRDGIIVRKDFTMVLFPKAKFADGITPDYIVGLLSKENKADWSPAITCLCNGGEAVQPAFGPSDRNMDANGNRIESVAPMISLSSFQANFDIIELAQGNLRGVAIPLWGGMAGAQTYEFAVDFGTSNTHIEYKTAGANLSYPLDIQAACRQIGTFNQDALDDPTYNIALKNNCIPQTMGGAGEIHFPMRTLLTYKRGTNWQQPAAPYITGNMSFYHGTIAQPRYNDSEFNLKWSADAANTAMIECYLGSLMHIMRNKVVMEGGDLAATRITWFYPTSMPAARVATISAIWSRLYQRHIGNDAGHNLKTMPESVAPYAYYQANIGAAVNVLTVDIGGGTSDAYVVDADGTPAFITSFRFAADSLLGDGAARIGGLATNGFVKAFRPRINSILEDNGLGELKNILDRIADGGNSANYIANLFGLKENTDVINARCADNLDFLRMLQQSEGAKTLVLIFYTAIIYHLATFIKAKREAGANVQEPVVLAFSGNGSKLLQVLGINTDIGRDSLTSYTKAIFEKINGRNYPHGNFSIVTDTQKPKEATCKGGLFIAEVPNHEQVRNITDTLLGTSGNAFAGNKQYDQLEEADMAGIENTIRDFTRMFFELAREKDIHGNLGTVDNSVLNQHKELFTANVRTNVQNYLRAEKLDSRPEKIEGSLFFYPITELLKQLAMRILQ